MDIRVLRRMLALSLVCQPLLQAQTLSTIAQEMRAQQSALHKLVTPTRIFSRPRSNISSLVGLDQIPNIEYTWIVNLPGNKIDTLPPGFFKNPKFKNVRWLNLSHNRFRNIEPEGLEGLENLWVLLLDHNQLRSLKPGTLKALKSLKVLTLNGNPRDEALAEQARKELPGTLVTNKKMTKNFMLWTLRIVGVAAIIAMTAAGIFIALKQSADTQPPTGQGSGGEPPLPAPEDPRVTVGEIRAEKFRAQKIQILKRLAPNELSAVLRELPVDQVREFLPEDFAELIKNAPEEYRERIILEATANWPDAYKIAIDEALGTPVGSKKGKEPKKTAVLMPPGPNGPAELPSARLYQAAQAGDLDAVSKLLATGVDPNVTDEPLHRTPLMAAADRGDLDVAKKLILARADINLKDDNGKTAFDLALEMAGEDRAKLRKLRDLLTPAMVGKTLTLHGAAYVGSIATIQKLIEQGADINAPSGTRGQTPLAEAIESNRLDAARYLVGQGARVGDVEIKMAQRKKILFEDSPQGEEWAKFIQELKERKSQQ